MNERNFIWYTKWCATLTLIIGTFVNALGYYPEGPIILALGGSLWAIVAYKWKEPALIATNAILVLVGISGLLYNYYSAI
jgi:hypothetical protein